MGINNLNIENKEHLLFGLLSHKYILDVEYVISINVYGALP